MNSEPLFSVVVPMYNVEQFLPKCIDSLLAQTLSDIEVILVDDGSPDRCGEIAESYAKKDSRITVIHRMNGGLGPARNSGIVAAHGEYIGFVDGDDWVEPEMYETLYATASHSNADVVFTGMKTVRCGKVIEARNHPYAGKVLSGADEIFDLRRAFYGAAPERVLDDPTPISVWIGGYRRQLLRSHSLRFLNIRSEDKFFNTFVCRAANTVSCALGTPYCYRKDDQSSITQTFDSKTIDSFFRLFRLLVLVANEEPEVYRNECYRRMQRCVIENQIWNVLHHPVLREACKKYPWWKLPFKQALFYLCESLCLPKTARALVRASG